MWHSPVGVHKVDGAHVERVQRAVPRPRAPSRWLPPRVHPPDVALSDHYKGQRLVYRICRWFNQYHFYIKLICLWEGENIVRDSLKCKALPLIALQDLPSASSRYPSAHAHTNEPIVLRHRCAQLSSCSHSSLSVDTITYNIMHVIVVPASASR